MATGKHEGLKSECIAIKLAMSMAFTSAGLAAGLKFLLKVASQARQFGTLSMMQVLYEHYNKQIFLSATQG